MKKKVSVFIVILLCFDIFAQKKDDIYIKLLKDNDKCWISNDSMKVLYFKDREKMKDYYPDIETLSFFHELKEKMIYWYEMDCFVNIEIFPELLNGKDCLCFSWGNEIPLLSFYFELKEIKGSFYYLQTEKTFNCKQNENTNPFSKWPIEEDECEMILKFDGDYLYVYLNDLKTLYGTFCRINNATLDEYNKLIKTGKCDLSKVTWPRHADGTCDYDGSSKTTKSPVSTSSTTTAPSTNVTVNKNMLVTENLKLRSGEATTTSVLTVMAAGTKVKILELGKAENIDGIDSNWVKVEIISGKDRNGKELKSGLSGWCYGGYLQ